MKAKCIMIVFGDYLKDNLSNVKTIDTKVIPNVGDSIVIKKGRYKINSRLIDYRNVEDYELDSDERGKEMVYIFV